MRVPLLGYPAVVLMSLSFGEDTAVGISFSKARIVGVKDEDRDHIHLIEKTTATDFDSVVPSFAVFDGHGGHKSANICEEKLYTAVRKSYSDYTTILSTAAGYSTPLRDEDIVDALFVRAIHDGVEAVHEASVKESETAGTTMCSLFLIPVDHQKHVHGMRQSDPWQPPQADVAAAEMGVAADCGRSYKVLCANIGDSRCVMVGCSAEPLQPPSSSPSGWKSTSRNTSLTSGEEHSVPYVRRGSSSGKLSPPTPSGDHDTAAHLRRGNTSSKEFHSPPSQSGKFIDRFKRYVGSYSRSDEDALSSSLHLDFSLHQDASDHHPEESSPAGGKTMQVCVRAVAMSEDHKPSNKRERFRVEKRLKIGQQVLPVPLKAFDQSDEDFVQLYCHRHTGHSFFPYLNSFLEEDSFVSEHGQLNSPYLSSLYTSITDLVHMGESSSENDQNQLLIDFESSIFGQNIDSAFLNRLSSATELLQHLFADKFSSNDMGKVENDSKLNVVRNFSCFQFRQGNTASGPTGPEAYYPRFSNTSLLMTRSVGDKNGPRGCLARAEITSVTVHSTQHARFVLASDGVWDVIDEELVRKMGLYYKYKDPRDFAIYLAEKALKRRIKQGISKDDITVFVIDVNPRNAVFIKTQDSREGHYYPAFHCNTNKKWMPMKSASATMSPSPSPSRKEFDATSEGAGGITTMGIDEYYSSRRCSQS